MNKLDKQSIRVFIITVSGVLLAYFNVIYLFPKFLSQEIIGYYRTVIAISTFLYPIAHIGLTNAFLRNHHIFSTDKQLFSFLNYTFLRSLLVFIAFSMAFYIVSPFIMTLFDSKAEILNNHWTETLIIIGLMVVIEGFMMLFRVKKIAWLGSLVQNIIIRILTAFLVVIYLIYNNLSCFSTGLVLVYILVVITCFFILKSKIGYSFSVNWILPIKKNMNIWGYSFSTLIAFIAHKMTLHIDSIMVSFALGLEQNSIYTTAFLIASVVEFPKRAASTVITPRYSSLLEKNHLQILNKLFKHAAIEQAIIGFWILGLIILNISSMYKIMPNGELYQSGLAIVHIIAIVKCIDLIFGHNTEVLILSRFYKYLSFLNIFVLFGFIIGNYYAMGIFGIQGVAWVTFTGIVFYNIFKSFFLWLKFKVIFDMKITIIIIGVFCLTFYISDSLIKFSNPYIDIFLTTILFSFIYIYLVLKSKISSIISMNTYKKLLNLSL